MTSARSGSRRAGARVFFLLAARIRSASSNGPTYAPGGACYFCFLLRLERGFPLDSGCLFFHGRGLGCVSRLTKRLDPQIGTCSVDLPPFRFRENMVQLRRGVYLEVARERAPTPSFFGSASPLLLVYVSRLEGFLARGLQILGPDSGAHSGDWWFGFGGYVPIRFVKGDPVYTHGHRSPSVARDSWISGRIKLSQHGPVAGRNRFLLNCPEIQKGSPSLNKHGRCAQGSARLTKKIATSQKPPHAWGKAPMRKTSPERPSAHKPSARSSRPSGPRSGSRRTLRLGVDWLRTGQRAVSSGEPQGAGIEIIRDFGLLWLPKKSRFSIWFPFKASGI